MRVCDGDRPKTGVEPERVVMVSAEKIQEFTHVPWGGVGWGGGEGRVG